MPQRRNSLIWYKLSCCILRFPARHILHILNRPRCIVLFLISFTDQILQAFAARLYRSNADLLLAYEDASVRVFEERPPPAARLHTPRSDEDALLRDDGPDPNDAMG